MSSSKYFLLISISFLLLMISTSFSQSVIDLYQDYLPPEILKNPTYKNGVDISLHYSGNICADLIYYRIKYFTRLVQTGATDSIGPYLTAANSLQTLYLQQRSNWSSYQLKNIDTFTSNFLKREMLVALFEGYLQKTDSATLSLDTNLSESNKNKLEYFSHIFLTKRKLSYDSTVNYYLENKNIYQERVDSLNSQYRNFQKYDENKKEDILRDNVLSWFLVGRNLQNKYNVHTEYDAYELSIAAYDRLFVSQNNFIIGFAYNVVNPSLAMTHPANSSDQLTDTYTVQFKFRDSVLYHPSSSITLGYRIPLRSEVSPFSHLTILTNFSLLFRNDYEENNKTKFIYSYRIGIVGVGAFADSVSFKNLSFDPKVSFSLRFSTPVYYFTPHYYFEFGAGIWYQSIGYNIYISKRHFTDDKFTSESTQSFHFEESYIESIFTFTFNGKLIDNIYFTTTGLKSKYRTFIETGISYYF